MIVNDAPETASKNDKDNMHDLIAGNPWLLNPEWQVLAEERTISKQLKEWGAKDIADEDARLRYDFLALQGDGKLVVLEIKRSAYAVDLEDLQRLEKYKERLSTSHKDICMVLICGNSLNISEKTQEAWEGRPDGEIRRWSVVHEKTRQHYEHYRAVLEGNVEDDDFSRKTREVLQTRKVLEGGSVHRDPNVRKAGLGPQDVDYSIGREQTPTAMRSSESEN